MIRALAIFLIVWAQLFVGCLQSNFVLCVHEDGSTAIELASARCCDVDLSCSPPIADDGCSHEANENDAVGQGEDDCCQDFLLQQPQLTISPSDATPDHSHHEVAQATRAVLPASLTAAPPMVRSPLVGDRGPPRPDIVRRCLRTVRLRC